MIGAKQAIAAPRLLYHWFVDSQVRSKYKIPHYLIGGLVHYQPSELFVWAARSTAAQGRDGDADAEEAE